jgi:hypothetical protein
LKDKLRFDEDDDFARSTVFTATGNKGFISDGSDEETKEPERDFDKLRARIKLRAIKKFKEDERDKM